MLKDEDPRIDKFEINKFTEEGFQSEKTLVYLPSIVEAKIED